MKNNISLHTAALFITALLLTTWLSACSSSVSLPINDTTSGVTSPERLRGGEWLLESLRNGNASYPDVRSMNLFRTPAMSFRDSLAGGNSSCNAFGGELRVWATDSLTIRGVVATKIACNEPSGSLEHNLFNALEETVRYSFTNTGKLRLHTRSGGELILYRSISVDTSFAAELVNLNVLDYINYPYDMRTPAFILGDTMYAELGFSGCQPHHSFALLINNSYDGGVDTDTLYGDVVHFTNEACMAYFTRRLAIDLRPVKAFWQARSGREHGTVYLRLPNRVTGGTPLAYSF